MKEKTNKSMPIATTMARLLAPFCLVMFCVYPPGQASSTQQSSSDFGRGRVEVEIVSAEAAKNSYLILRQKIAEWNTASRPSPSLCSKEPQPIPCIFVSKFPLAQTGYDIDACAEHRRPHFAWVPMNEAAGGSEALADWKVKSSQGHVFDCDGTDCKIIVRALAFSSQEDSLARCNIAKVRDTLGATSDCEPVVIMTTDVIWVRVVTGFSRYECLANSVVPDIKVFVNPKQKSDVFKEAFRRAFSEGPLSLAVQLGTGKIVGTASFRVSPVLRPYRERVTARGFISEEQTSPRFVGLSLDIDLIVNRYNTTRDQDWHLPSKQQEDLWAKTALDQVRKFLNNACPNHHWRDDFTFLCELPPNTELPDIR
jgi:hypothetical protein